MTTSPALALPELPVAFTWRHDIGALFVHEQLVAYGQQCAQAQGEAQAAEIAELKALLERCKEWHQGDKWRDGNPDKRQAWEAHMRALDAALKSEAA